MIITFISDTHTKHKKIENDLPGGDVIIHAGDCMSSGYSFQELRNFLKWFNSLNSYTHKIFIGGNHDRVLENEPEQSQKLLAEYPFITYLQDTYTTSPNCKIYGTPWQPEFCNWAFNLPRDSEILQAKWELIPENTDILVTHGPPYGLLDIPGGQSTRVGCQLLRSKIEKIKPKIHVFGHIHGSAGYIYQDGTHFLNASVLNEQYMYTNLPLTFDWDPCTNLIKWYK